MPSAWQFIFLLINWVSGFRGSSDLQILNENFQTEEGPIFGVSIHEIFISFNGMPR